MIADALLDTKIGKIDACQLFSVYLLFVFMVDLFKHPGGVSGGGDTNPPHKQTPDHNTNKQTEHSPPHKQKNSNTLEISP